MSQQPKRVGSYALAGLAAFVLLSPFAPAPPQEEGALVRFQNGEVADADDVNANFDLLEQRLFDAAASATALAARVDELQTENAALAFTVTDLAARLQSIEGVLTPENLVLLSQVLPVVSFVDLADGEGGSVPAMRFTGVNVQIVNGRESTNESDGTGNLIVGFNELGAEGARTGSHNLVLGVENAYTATGGLVAGLQNLISGPGSVVLGGQLNRSTGSLSVVGGGRQRVAAGEFDFAAGSLLEDE